MPTPVLLYLVQGDDANWDLEANTDDGPFTDLLPSDTLSAKLWPGGSTPTLFAPTVVLQGGAPQDVLTESGGTILTEGGTTILTEGGAPGTTFTMTVTAAQSRTLNWGVSYAAQVYRTRAGLRMTIGLATVQVIAQPTT